MAEKENGCFAKIGPCTLYPLRGILCSTVRPCLCEAN